ncbi:hypothetical protein PINS_up000873 [Pythium insidiosum]|nr:hypothetical protein PINS_up000873 [Pythium insidiosum]
MPLRASATRRYFPFVALVLFAVFWGSTAAYSHQHKSHHHPHHHKASTTTDNNSMSKIEPSLLAAIENDPEITVDVMIQLTSPEDVRDRACQSAASLSRSDKTTCMVNNLQQFADETQAPVLELLAQNPQAHGDVQSLWINNSIAVKQCKGSLIVALAAVDGVVQIRPEEVLQLLTGSDDKHTHKTKTQSTARAATFGMSVLDD